MKLIAPLLFLIAGGMFPSLAGGAEQSHDVIVYGGTPGGVTAAVAACRNGARVLLLEQTGHVGGLSTSGLNTSEAEHMLDEASSGLALEFYTRVGKAYGFDKPLHCWESRVAERVFNEMLKDVGATVQLHKRLARVEMKDRRIERLVCTDGTAVSGKVFIDATYEGDLMAAANVSHTFGRESIATYDEPLAGIRLQDGDVQASPYDDQGKLLPGFVAIEDMKAGAGDQKVMNYNFRLTVSKSDDRVPFPKPAAYDPARYVLLSRLLANRPDTRLKQLIDFYPYPSGKYAPDAQGRLNPIPTDKWEMNNKQNSIISIGHFGGQFDYPAADEAGRNRIEDDHVSYTQGLLYFLSHDPSVPQALRSETQSWGLAPDEYQDNNHWPYSLYVREARRMIGPHVLTQHDVQTRRSKEDSIGLGSHWLDSHHVQRVAVSKTAFRNEGRIWVTVDKAYQIPYRSLTPAAKECSNLLVPICLSASHVAFCSLRVEPTWMTTGHAAGTAAALCATSGQAVQELDIKTLQQRLRQEKLVIDLPD